jgi:hypothetical protein
MTSPRTAPNHRIALPDEWDGAALARWVDDGGFVPPSTEDSSSTVDQGDDSSRGFSRADLLLPGDGNSHPAHPVGNEPELPDPEKAVARGPTSSTQRRSPAEAGSSMTTNPPSDSRQDGVTNAPAIPDPAARARGPKSGTPKRVLIALACPPALVAVSVCHTALAVTYWIAFASTLNSLYLSVATSYSVVALISLWKVHETFQTDRRSSRKPRGMRSN